jgi:capsular polysaccharide transport system permease protein
MVGQVVTELRVIKALMERDLMTRFGRENIGFVWVIVEPMLLCVGVMLIFSQMKDASGAGHSYGSSIAAFIFSGYMLLTLMRHLTNNSVLLFSRSIPLFYHRMIGPNAIFFSRMILEFVATTLAALIIYAILLILGFAEPMHDPAIVLAGWMLMGWFAMGLGSMLLIASEANEFVERFIPPFQYLTVPLSGTFFMFDWVPIEVQEVLVWNPLAHPYEMVRAGLFGPNLPTTYYPWYTFGWGLAMLGWGMYKFEETRASLRF